VQGGYQWVPPIAQVPMPGHPAGLSPNLTQYPTAPPSGFVPPQVQMMPGPATIGGGPLGPGGVAGVQMSPVANVAPPVTGGGPHTLPPFPSFPLPQGFPNPFAQGPVAMGGGPPVPGGGAGQTVTGPQGYFPGIGWVGQQGQGGPPMGGYPGGGFPGGGFPGGAMPMGGFPGGGFPGAAMPMGGFPGGGFPGAAMPMGGFPGGPPPAGGFPGAPYGGYPGGSPSIGGFPGGPPPAGGFPGGGVPMGGFPGGPPGGGFAAGPAPAGFQGGAAPFGGFPGGPAPTGFQGGAPAPVVAADVPASTAPQTERAQPGPFWLHLGWQLLQTPAVRAALGDLFDQLVYGENRLATVKAAAGALTNHELQLAFQRVTAGEMEQSAFTQLFALRLKEALGRAE
jgi:hypothetical protein